MMFRSNSSNSSSNVAPLAPSFPHSPSDLCCFLCKNIFTEPLLLSCGHSFCLQCVQPWLRRSTVCPFCRSPTLKPILNTKMAKIVAEFKSKNNNNQIGKSNFIRNAIRRTMQTSKEAKVLQREAVRASQRRPKNVVLPKVEGSPKVSELAAKLEGKLRIGKKTGKADEQQQFPRMGNLRKSFVRIRNKFGQQQPNKDYAEGHSVHSFRSAVTGSATSLITPPPPCSNDFVLVISAVAAEHQKCIWQAFATHLRNVELIGLMDGKKSPTELISAIRSSGRMVFVYQIDQKGSFESIRKVIEYCPPEEIVAMKTKAKFVLIGINANYQESGRKVDRMSGERLANELGTRLNEIELRMLEKTFPIWFHSIRPNLANDLSIRSAALATNRERQPPIAVSLIGGGSSLRPPSSVPRSILQLVSPQRSLISSTTTNVAGGNIRPSMGLSASALRRSTTTAFVEGQIKTEKKKESEGGGEEEGGRGGGGGSGCVMM